MATLEGVKFVFDQIDKSQQRIQQATEQATAERVNQIPKLAGLGLSISPDGTVQRITQQQNPFLQADIQATSLRSQAAAQTQTGIQQTRQQEQVQNIADLTGQISQAGSPEEQARMAIAFESVFGLQAGSLNPEVARRQIAETAVIEQKAAETSATKGLKKAQTDFQVTAQLQPTIEAAYKSIDFEFDDLTDEDDLDIILKEGVIEGVIANIVDETGVPEQNVANSVFQHLVGAINEALDDVEAGEFRLSEAQEKSVIAKLKQLKTKLRNLRDGNTP